MTLSIKGGSYSSHFQYTLLGIFVNGKLGRIGGISLGKTKGTPKAPLKQCFVADRAVVQWPGQGGAWGAEAAILKTFIGRQAFAVRSIRTKARKRPSSL